MSWSLIGILSSHSKERRNHGPTRYWVRSLSGSCVRLRKPRSLTHEPLREGTQYRWAHDSYVPCYDSIEYLVIAPLLRNHVEIWKPCVHEANQTMKCCIIEMMFVNTLTNILQSIDYHSYNKLITSETLISLENYFHLVVYIQSSAMFHGR